jgi:hypothetical protein
LEELVASAVADTHGSAQIVLEAAAAVDSLANPVRNEVGAFLKTVAG